MGSKYLFTKYIYIICGILLQKRFPRQCVLQCFLVEESPIHITKKGPGVNPWVVFFSRNITGRLLFLFLVL